MKTAGLRLFAKIARQGGVLRNSVASSPALAIAAWIRNEGENRKCRSDGCGQRWLNLVTTSGGGDRLAIRYPKFLQMAMLANPGLVTNSVDAIIAALLLTNHCERITGRMGF